MQEVAFVASHLPSADIVTVRTEKPSAIVMAHSAGVEVTRNRAFFANRATNNLETF